MSNDEQKAPPFVLPKLPWEKNAFANKGISEETINFHYGFHHKGYVDKLNQMAEKDPQLATKTLEDIIVQVQKGPSFNLAAQIWNHTFYWNCMSPEEKDNSLSNFPSLEEAIKKRFNDVKSFTDEFKTRATNHFGSGWVWLVYDSNKNSLEIVDGHDAYTPLKDKMTCLLTIDVWEHAYYIDYRNDRPAYINTFFNLINWGFVSKNLEAVIKK